MSAGHATALAYDVALAVAGFVGLVLIVARRDQIVGLRRICWMAALLWLPLFSALAVYQVARYS